jgi:hypothetical protein
MVVLGAVANKRPTRLVHSSSQSTTVTFPVTNLSAFNTSCAVPPYHGLVSLIDHASHFDFSFTSNEFASQLAQPASSLSFSVIAPVSDDAE